ncbi:MAG TPA: MarR family winged helix-turn-helix transcriptional regulator [Feifaniaceae bacterium]|nr:MarR family winged helix-turn-helix transcriptional regulator [Feifaniaceae bacterium]
MSERSPDAGLQLEQFFCLRRTLQRKAAETFPLHCGQLPVLEYIRGNPGCTQVQIAEALLISPSSVAQSTKRMQRDGLLKKRTEEDQRCNRLYLTERGEQVSKACKQRYMEVDADVFSALSRADMEALSVLLGKLIKSAADRARLDTEHLDFESLMRLKRETHEHMLGEKTC